MAWSFQWPAVTQEPTQSCLISKKDAHVTQDTSRGLGALHQELGAKKNMYFLSFHTGNGSPLQYSYLENPMDRGAWRATVCGAAESWTRLSTHAGMHYLTKALLCVPWFVGASL